MVTVTVDTFWAKIFVGFKDTSGTMPSDLLADLAEHDIPIAREICSNYVNEVGLCVTFTPTEYIYSNDYGQGYAGEKGIIIGLINYPRIPAEPDTIRARAMELANILKNKFNQRRVSVMFPDKTIMLGEVE